MKEWVLSVAVTALICGLIFLILPEGKISVAIKTIISLVSVLVVIQPFAGTDVSELLSVKSFYSGEISIQEEYIEYANLLRGNAYKKQIVKNLEKIGITLCDENIIIISEGSSENGFLAKGVEINLKNAVIINENEHIDIKEEVISVVSETLGITANKVIIYER